MAAALPQAVVDRMRRLNEIHAQDVVAEIVGVNRHTVSKAKLRGWKRGQPGPALRSMPGDYPIQRNHMTKHQLARHYRTSLAVVTRWDAELGTPRAYEPRPSSHEKKPTPSDIVEVIAALGATAAAAHFGVHPNTLVRMRRDAGLPLQARRANRSTTKGDHHG
jgi:hypothetical protein